MTADRWNDPRVLVTLILICLFGYAYVREPGDEAMKGALIAAFAAAYGYWIGANQSSAKATENTSDAFAAVREAIASRPPDAPAGTPDDPLAVKEVR
jgi:hypothetical protein